ncbi:MAG: AMP-binding protein [Gammaproteobacteria bacterium]|nr:AMP-binding protein [Gammaproteobacteria bacterium]
MSGTDDQIPLKEITNLSQLFCHRVRRNPNSPAYQYFDNDEQAWQELTWSDMADHVGRWQAAFKQEILSPGDRVALMASNSPSWVIYDQAALGMGFVVVPLYTNDRADNVSYIINDAQIRVLLLETAAQWHAVKPHCQELTSLKRIVCMEAIEDAEDARFLTLDRWLPDINKRYPLHELNVHKSTLATIVYTSGTTGKPKGVMLSHENIFWNAHAGIRSIPVHSDDSFLSFLPLSHMFERTAGYYLPMICGSCVTYARSIEKLAEDLVLKRPTVLITVPRIFERVYNKIKIQLSEKPAFARKLFELTVAVGWHRFRHQQGKQAWHPKLLLWPLLNALVAQKIMAKLGGRLRLAVSGGAPLSFDIARTFMGLGLTISQGYGLTEASPVISTNKLEDNEPDSVGQALAGIETRLGEGGELLVRAPSVMMGYWNQEEATQAVIDADGWLHTGDKARIERDHIYITGRLKEILVLSNGEKLPPADLEMAISTDPLFDQALVLGEQKPYLAALLVFNPNEWQKAAAQLGITPDPDMLNHPSVHEFVLQRLKSLMVEFPGYAKIYRIYITLDPWTVENNLMTPTLKLKRQLIINHYSDEIKELYEGH